MIRPGRGDITTTRSERNTASGIEWVTNTTAAPVSAADARQLGLHPLARHLVERAERLVHQQQPRTLGERARDRDALLHAARELIGMPVGEVREPDQLRELGDARLALAPLPRRAARAAARCSRDRPPRQQAGLLEGDAVVLVPARAGGGLAEDLEVPEVGCRGRRSRRSSVDLPQPDGPMSETNSPAATVRSMPSSALTSPVFVANRF